MKFLMASSSLSHTQILFGVVPLPSALEVATGPVLSGKVSKGGMICREKGLWIPSCSQADSANGSLKI